MPADKGCSPTVRLIKNGSDLSEENFLTFVRGTDGRGGRSNVEMAGNGMESRTRASGLRGLFLLFVIRRPAALGLFILRLPLHFSLLALLQPLRLLRVFLLHLV